MWTVRPDTVDPESETGLRSDIKKRQDQDQQNPEHQTLTDSYRPEGL